jgi:hypothetical protein
LIELLAPLLEVVNQLIQLVKRFAHVFFIGLLVSLFQRRRIRRLAHETNALKQCFTHRIVPE